MLQTPFELESFLHSLAMVSTHSLLSFMQFIQHSLFSELFNGAIAYIYNIILLLYNITYKIHVVSLFSDQCISDLCVSEQKVRTVFVRSVQNCISDQKFWAKTPWTERYKNCVSDQNSLVRNAQNFRTI